MKIGIIGCGVMGGAIAGFLPRKELVGFDTNRCKVDALRIPVADSVESLISEVDCIFLAVKPQTFREMKVDSKDKLIISIMAGVKLADLPARSVRVMPNLGARVGKSVSSFVCGQVSSGDKIFVKNLLEKFGVAVEVKSDDEIDKMTALTGSGPAYLYMFLSALNEAGKEFGFDANTTRKVLDQLVLGALQAADGEDFDEMIKKVASKGGTTEAALKVLDEGKFKEVFKKAVFAAFERANTISQSKSSE